MNRALPLVVFVALSACGTGVARVATGSAPAAATALGELPRYTIARSVADSITTHQIAPGITQHDLVRNAGPLRAHVLDIDLAQCVSIRAVKGGPTAVGRATTTALLQGVPAEERAIAAVNADFFVFTPPGVPVNAMVVDGQLLSGPIKRPVLAIDAARRPFIGMLTVAGTVVSARGRLPFTFWNRPSVTGLGVIDAAWGQPLDTLVRRTALFVLPISERAQPRRYVLAALPVSHDGLARGDTLMLVGRSRGALQSGDTVTVGATLAPIIPMQAVGGNPLLLRDSVIVPTVDTDGAESFRGLNPRTAAGYADSGRRLLLVVIDGRQPGYSVGTTVRETAALLQDLGAREALNLDGGGSTAMIVRDPTSGNVHTVNKPSDAIGERPVGNAVVVTGSCRG